MEKKYKVSGMACSGCVAMVKRALEALSGVESVSVDLDAAQAVVTGNVSSEAVERAIEDAGFDYMGEV